jgi:hypothetical protein
MVYDIEVKQQGSPIAHHIVEAADALSAINRVERWYSDPVEYETVLIEDEHNQRHRVLLAHHWHGYTFEARAIEPYTANKSACTERKAMRDQCRALPLVRAYCP